MNRWWKPPDGAEAVLLALQSECDIRERARHLTHMAHREPWLIGSPDAVQTAIAWARVRHTESIARSRVLASRIAIPADQRRYPPGCPDPDWCRGNRACYWNCKESDDGLD